jgi:hypothetical protein
MLTRRTSLIMLGGLLSGASLGANAAAKPASCYLIGNSLTWDTSPPLLGEDVQWHVDCGVNLAQIHDRPEKPCVDSSTLWPKALRERQYDVVSVQPHYGTTLAQDAATISEWMELQPKAVFVVHSGWAFHAKRVEEWESAAGPDQMAHSPIYFRALLAELRKRHPGRELRQTFAQSLLAAVHEDIISRRAPFTSVDELYRDDIHLNDAGRYLMHQAMRLALGRPPLSKGFEKVSADVKLYLDGVLSPLNTSGADRAVLSQVLAPDREDDGKRHVKKISDPALRRRMADLLPDIVEAKRHRQRISAIDADVRDGGGKTIYAPAAPQWLTLASGDQGLAVFDELVAVDLYNGNNPLKGQGGPNQKVTDDWLKRLGELKDLRRLDLSNCAVNGDGLRHLTPLTNLRELNLTLTPVRDDALKPLAALTELRRLGLASTQCNGTGFAYLKSLRKLENVNLHFTPLNDAGLEAICQVPIANRLWFAHTHFTDAGAVHLRALKELKRCGIGSKEAGSTGEAVAALTGLPLLEDLSLLDNQATPTGIAHAAKIATLKRLDVSYGPTVGDESMPLIAVMPGLEELVLGSMQLTDDGLRELGKSKSLKRIILSDMRKVTPAGIAALSASRQDLSIETR